MAKLKIHDNDDPLLPNEQGYVNVVKNLLLKQAKYDDFVEADPEERPEYLVRAAGEDEQDRPCLVTHLPKGSTTPVEISNENCRIFGERDRRGKNKNRARFTIPMPDEQPPNLDYLKGYADVIYRLYKDAAAAATAAEAYALRDRAHHFMFGMMMLTRCR